MIENLVPQAECHNENQNISYNPTKHSRRSIRLKGYNYVQSGLYFIPICCHNRACVFGHIENGIMIMNDAGKMVENKWLTLPH